MLDRRIHEEDEEEIDSNGWLTTYSDTITLLLTFFILLYSMSVIDNEKLKQVSGALQNELTGNPLLVENIKEDLTEEIHTISHDDELDKLVDDINIILLENNLKDSIKIRKQENGVALQLGESALFDPGNAQLKESSNIILNTIGEILPKIDNKIIIEGHTDNTPINNSEYKTNWELSTARSVNVLKYFVEEKNFDPTKISASGYGEYRPLVENNTPENKSLNRRVDVLIVK